MSKMNKVLYNNNVASGIYVGDKGAARQSYLKALKKANIHGILNVAFDIDDDAFEDNGWILEFAKVGLLDSGPDPGKVETNQAGTMVAAVYMLDQLVTRVCSKPGDGVLVHCASGGSRSVTVAALWMAQRLPLTPNKGQTRFMTAINAVRNARGLGMGKRNIPYNPTNPNYGNPDPNARDDMWDDGKPMAALFYLGQALDESSDLFPSRRSPG